MTGQTPGGSDTARTQHRPVPVRVRPTVIIATLVVSAFVMILNETILSVALPHLTGDLGVSATTVQWLTSGFLLTMGVVIPTTGYILQRFTPRQVFLAAMTLFSLGTLICALSPGFDVLLAGRVVQATGTAVMIPLLMTSVMKLIPADRRGATMGTISIVIAVAPAIGPDHRRADPHLARLALDVLERPAPLGGRARRRLRDLQAVQRDPVDAARRALGGPVGGRASAASSTGSPRSGTAATPRSRRGRRW